MKSFFKYIIQRILILEARIVLWRFKPRIVAITGSVGKTSTKDTVAVALSAFATVRKSQKSFNSEFGVPLTILGLDTAWGSAWGWFTVLVRGVGVIFSREYPEWLVLEVGADTPGDIERITQWIHPDVSVVTQLSKVPVHVEFFSSPAEVAREKSFLVSATKKEGLVVLNIDDPDVMAMKKLSKSRTFTFGFSEDADVAISNETIVYENGVPTGMSCKANYDGNVIPLNIQGTIGLQLLYPLAAAMAVVAGLKLNVVDAGRAFTEYHGAPGRMRVLPAIKGATIIDDSYNSSPIALASALFTLKTLDVSGRRIAVLGDMLELGKYTTEEHKKAGRLCADVCDMLFVVGVRAKYVAEGAREKGMDESTIFECADAQKAGKLLEGMLKTGDVVLIKGSQGSGQNKIRTERAVKEIMAEPQRAEELLVRQGEGWE